MILGESGASHLEQAEATWLPFTALTEHKFLRVVRASRPDSGRDDLITFYNSDRAQIRLFYEELH